MNSPFYNLDNNLLLIKQNVALTNKLYTSDPDVRLEYLCIFIILVGQSRKCKTSISVKYFHIFFFITDIKIGYLKLGVMLFNSSLKTIYLR